MPTVMVIAREIPSIFPLLLETTDTTFTNNTGYRREGKGKWSYISEINEISEIMKLVHLSGKQ